jgi:hypothetical protein
MKLRETAAEGDAKLKEVASVANETGAATGGTSVHFDLPQRRPYEPKATKKQKDLLWALGVQDVPFLEALRKWQAVAMIDQIKAKLSKEGNRALLKMALILGTAAAIIYLLTRLVS